MPADNKRCSACEAVPPIEQFRPVKPRQPGHAPSRYHRCRVCQREAARLRVAHMYHTDDEHREKQLVNAAVQREDAPSGRDDATHTPRPASLASPACGRLCGSAMPRVPNSPDQYRWGQAARC